jgi:uncharacterized protein (TIGR02453 family)
MPGSSAFSGFSKQTVEFYTQLKKNNNKSWFEEHKSDYETYVMTPARDFVVAMGERLEKLSPNIHADPRVNKSIFRIYRDTRFSKDKTPYKTNLAMWWWEGEGPRMECSGYYIHIEPPNLMLGVGIYMFPRDMLKTYRDSVVSPIYGPALQQAIEEVSRQEKYSIGDKHYKRVPRGYDPDHENAELLLYNGLHAGFETDIPRVFYSEDLLDYCFDIYNDLYPIHKWLMEMTERA